MRKAARMVIVIALAATVVTTLGLRAAATEVATPPASGPARGAEAFAQGAGGRLDAAARALSHGYAHGTAQDLRQAALDFRQLGETLSPRIGRIYKDDALALESAAIDADDAKLRSRAALRRLSLQPRLHLAGYDLLTALHLVKAS